MGIRIIDITNQGTGFIIKHPDFFAYQCVTWHNGVHESWIHVRNNANGCLVNRRVVTTPKGYCAHPLIDTVTATRNCPPSHPLPR